MVRMLPAITPNISSTTKPHNCTAAGSVNSAFGVTW
jgi:hypothetical protein